MDIGTGFKVVALGVNIISNLLYLHIKIIGYKKQRKLGKLIIEGKRSFNSYTLMAISLLFILISSIQSFEFNYKSCLNGKCYVDIILLSLTINTIFIFKKSIIKSKLHENGLIIIEGIIFWKNITSYTWEKFRDKDNIKLKLFAKDKVLFIDKNNIEINFIIKKDDINRVENILNSRNITGTKFDG